MYRIIDKLRFLLLISTLLGVIGAKAQENAEPIITIHSSAFAEIGDSNKFSLFLGTFEPSTYTVEQWTGTTQVEVQPGYFNNETGEFEGTWIPCSVDADGYIKIYGDPENINILSAEGAYITSIDMDQCVNLEALNLQHNALQRLDLTPFTKAFAIYLSDNPFTAETPLKVGAPKPDLAILEIDIVDHLDQSFNLSDYPNMVAFDGYYNRDLRNVDPTGCPNLMVLSVELTPVETLDVSQNPELMRLNISESRIRSIDLSQNPKLQHLLGSHDSGFINTDIKLEGIDLTHNPELTLLNLSRNGLTSIDISKNTLLTNLNLGNNLLTSIDLSANTNLYSVSILNNKMDFATLPSPQPTWGEYYYFQLPIDVPRSIATGATLDLSDKVLRPGTETSVEVYRQPYDREPFLLNPALYSYEDGKLTFNTAVADSVYAVFSNSELYEYPLQTTPFLIKTPDDMDTPSVIAKFALFAPVEGNLRFSVGIGGASEDSPKSFIVRAGEEGSEFVSTFATPGATTEYNVDMPLPEGYTGLVEVLLNEGDVMTSLDVSSIKLSSLNVQAATELRTLSANDCGLYNIDLRYNRCLNTLNLSGNELFKIDLAGIYGNYEKHTLFDIDLSHNQLTEVNISSLTQIKNIDLSYNKLTEYVLKDYDSLETLDLSHNELEGEISLRYLAGARGINLSANHLQSVLLPEFTALESIDLSDNNLTIATLPLTSEVNAASGYIYAPQKPIEIETRANAIDLSAQYRDIDGAYTTFTWLNADGQPLVSGTDVVCTDGETIFLNNGLGKVHCHLTHPAFPQFEGEKVLSTTDVEVTGAPDVLVATFTTLEDSEDGEVIFASNDRGTLFIDWKGDGSDMKAYPTAEKYIDYPGQHTYAGANVKVYSFSSPENITVFSLYDMKLADVDLSALTGTVSISVGGAAITPDDIVMPENPDLLELNLNGNDFTEYPYTGKYPALVSLVLANNQLSSFDASTMPSLEVLNLDNNHLSGITFDNPHLWGVSLASNDLTEIDLHRLPLLHQLGLSHNQLSHIDLEPVSETIHVVDISANKFTFATFPDFYTLPELTQAYISNQADVEAECVDGKVDLSSMLQGNGVGTTFTWYVGEAYYDSETGTIVGDQLIEGEDYTLDGGVTTFLKDIDGKAMCILANDLYPGVLLKTPLIAVSAAGITDVVADTDTTVDVYNMLGVAVKTGVSRTDALRGLAPGIYVVGSRKVVVK